MPTHPIAQPKLFIMDLLEYLKHAYQFLQYKKNPASTAAPVNATPKMGNDGILTPLWRLIILSFSRLRRENRALRLTRF